jgi:prevent-host-death family protein
MTTITVTQARENLADLLNKAHYAGERIIVEKRGKKLAAIISIHDLELLDSLIEQKEDEIDNAAVEKELSKKRKSKTVPWDTLKKELDL